MSTKEQQGQLEFSAATGIFLLVFGARVQDKERVRTRKSKAIFFERIKS